MKILKRVRVGWEYVNVTPYTDQYVIYEPIKQRCFVFDAADVPHGIEQITIADMDTKVRKFVG